jgi:hypothetical protein
MTNDRNYLRMLSDSGLIDAARAGDNDLALVLAERLRALLDVQTQLETVTNERDELDARCDIWKQQAIEAMDELDALRGVK